MKGLESLSRCAYSFGLYPKRKEKGRKGKVTLNKLVLEAGRLSSAA